MIIAAIKDKAIEAFGTPIFVKTKGMAIRMFLDEQKNPESQMNKHPDDYDLWMLGHYDDNTGVISQTEITVLVRGADQNTA